MKDLISQFGGVVGLISGIVGIVFFIFVTFNKNYKKLKKEETDTAKDVIDLLTSKVTVLEGKVKELETKVDILTTENKTLRDVLQGRDGETKQFYQDAYAAMKVIEHNDKVSEENSRTLAKIATLLETVIKVNQ